MATTIVGYNRHPSTGAATQVLGCGTILVDKDGVPLVLPAGNIVVSVNLKHLSTSPPPAPDGGCDVADAVEIKCCSASLLKASFVALTSNDHVVVEGSGSPASPSLAKTSNCDLKIHGVAGCSPANLANNGAVFCCLIKYKPMPTL